MPHVQVAGGVGEHVQHVPPLPAAVVERREGAVLLPELLPAFLGADGVVALADLLGGRVLLKNEG